MTITHYDVVVVGSGKSGVPVAIALAGAGRRRTAVVERSHIGGTSANEGSTPSKTMIASGRVAYLARRSRDYGVSLGLDTGDGSGSSPLPLRVEVDMAEVRWLKRGIADDFSTCCEEAMSVWGIDIIRGEARFVAPRTLAVRRLNENDERTNGEAPQINGKAEQILTADTIFLNVGARPARPHLPGLEALQGTGRVLDSTSIMELAEVPAHLIVVGGGCVGVEFGQLFRRLGSEVTIVQRADQLVPREDEDVAKCVLDILREDGITVLLSARAVSIRSTAKGDANGAVNGDGGEMLPLTLDVEGAEGRSFTVRGSHVLLATGRVPNTDTLNLEAGGVDTTTNGHVVVDGRLATSAAGVYSMGDANGGPAFAHMSFDDYRVIRGIFIGDSMHPDAPVRDTTSDSVSRMLVPYVVYMDPQLAHVGLHERDVARRGRPYKTACWPMSQATRALQTDETRGMMKAHVDAATGQILGFTCVGVEGGEVMAIVQAAMMGGLPWWDLESAVWAHPSLAEGLNQLWRRLE